MHKKTESPEPVEVRFGTEDDQSNLLITKPLLFRRIPYHLVSFDCFTDFTEFRSEPWLSKSALRIP
jgi:hypothetical protein